MKILKDWVGEGSTTLKIGLYTNENPCTGLTVTIDKNTNTVVSVVQVVTSLEMRFLKFNFFNKVREEINASLWSYPKEYILEFPFTNRSFCFIPYRHQKVLGNVITNAVN